MASRTNPMHDAAVHGTWLLLEIGREIRIARIRAGKTQRQVGAMVGCSASHISRIERGKVRRVAMTELALVAAAVGLKLWMRTYPNARLPLDGPQLRLIKAFNARLSPLWRRELEAVIQRPGDFRAVDELIRTDECSIAIEAITRFADVQAQVRQARTKQRDMPAERLILLVKGSHANRRMLHEASPLIRETFRLAPRRALRALAEGRDPGADCLLVL